MIKYECSYCPGWEEDDGKSEVMTAHGIHFNWEIGMNKFVRSICSRCIDRVFEIRCQQCFEPMKNPNYHVCD